ncbi:MAG: peptidoglycan DD-metalloendopeptidase family protein [Gammaproteobacteria bacterium]
MFQTREISYDYKICIGWGEERRRLRRRRLALASAAPLVVALMAGMASDHLSNHQFHLPPWDKPLVDQKPSPEKLLPIRTTSEAAIAYQAVLSELEPVSNPFTPNHIIGPTPAFPGTQEDANAESVPANELSAAEPDAEATPAAEAASTDANWQTIKVRAGDSLSTIFQRLGLSGNELDRIMGLGAVTAALKTLRPESNLRFRINGGSLSEMVHEIDAAHTLHVRNQEGGYSAETIAEKLETRTTQASGVITSSLFEAGQSAGLSDTAIMNMANIFDFDIDLALDIREGDRFTVVYEEIYKDGKKIKDGNILAAEFVNKDRFIARCATTTSKATRNITDRMAAPCAEPSFAHPWLSRASRPGLAFAITPSSIEFEITKALTMPPQPGRQLKPRAMRKLPLPAGRGYGRVIQLQHEGGYMTVYGHLSRFASSAKVGQRVHLGEVIGYVGMTGLATGPHLHYEFRVKGVHVDPLTVKLPQALPIARERLADFKAKTQPTIALLDKASTLAATNFGKQQAAAAPESNSPEARNQVVASAAAH